MQSRRPAWQMNGRCVCRPGKGAGRQGAGGGRGAGRRAVGRRGGWGRREGAARGRGAQHDGACMMAMRWHMMGSACTVEFLGLLEVKTF